jgi:hypothetical protein
MWMISGFMLVEFSPDSTPLETRLQSQWAGGIFAGQREIEKP